MADTRFTGTIQTAHGPLDLSGRMRIMGILNVTPDSFSEAGRFAQSDVAVEQAARMVAEGADVVDIGGESTRPGSEEVAVDEQLRRILPVIERIRAARQDVILSIDTRSAAVAEAALDAGADIINDVSALQHDPAMVSLLARRPVPVILMHMKGTPKTMVLEAHYQDVVTEVAEYFRRRLGDLARAGIDPARTIIDPGIGFAKNTFHNLQVLNRLAEFHALGVPLLVGPSRKRFIGHVLGIDSPGDRLYGTLAAVSHCAQAHVHIVRVHDVAPARQVADMLWAIGNPDRYL